MKDIDSMGEDQNLTPFDAFRELAKKLVQVPKAEADKREEEYQREQAEKPKRGPKQK